ncbi:hypothetical protein ACI0ZS_000302 [Cronobacter turicensis]
MNNDELIAAGHELAKCLDNEPLLDIAKLLSKMATQLDVTTAALREKTKQCEQLAAENAGLKDALAAVIDRSNEPDYQSIGMGCGVEDNGLQTDGYNACEYGWREAMERIYSEVIPEELPETPATDAFLREVRAQTWTEGNEPKEFGRYWVRYEADVGPQYCSAQWMEYNFCAPSNTNVHKIWLADHSRSVNSLKGVTHYTKLPDALESAQLRQGGAA